jgi:Ion channel
MSWINRLKVVVSRKLAVSALIALAAGPWVFAVRSGMDALGLLAFGIVFGCSYASFFGLTAGAIVGAASLFYLGPFLSALAPFVTSKESLLAVVGGTGFFFAILWDIAIQVAAPKLAEIADAEEGRKKDNTLLNILQFFIPLLTLFYLRDFSSVQLDEGWILGALAVFFASNIVGFLFLAHCSLDIRPAGLFYKELMPLLIAMRGGLVSFAIGYGLTAFCFAGVYAALYRINPARFSIPGGLHPTMWDFIYFSLTTITTIGLSDIKPASNAFAPQAAVSAELIVGVFWVVIYFAIAMTLLQVYVRDLLERLAKSQQHPPQSTG